MQVYLVTMKEKYPDMLECFRNYQDIEPSIRISYGSCVNVVIVATPQVSGGPFFKVTGLRDGVAFDETLQVKRLAVWDSPTHI